MYSPVVLFSQFWTSQLFHAQFCFFLTWYRYRRRQGWSGIPISLRILHSLLWFTVKSFSIVTEAEVDVFLEHPCSFYDPTDMSNLTSGSSAFSKSSLNIWFYLLLFYHSHHLSITAVLFLSFQPLSFSQLIPLARTSGTLLSFLFKNFIFNWIPGLGSL